MFKLKPIFTALSPNVQKDDIFLAFKLIFQIWKWRKGSCISKLENKFKEYLQVKNAISFNSGRVSFLAILESIGVQQDDEILIQAFTCNAVINPIINKRGTPIFVDIDNTLNIDPEELQKKITQKTKAIVVQHTFGFPAQIDKIANIAKQNNLILIEDCAHCIGSKYKGKLCGTFGDVAFFSFGRSKVISSVFGGLITTNNQQLAEKIKSFQDNLKQPSHCWVLQQLLHPVLTNIVLYTYGLSYNLGKVLLVALNRLHILSKAITKKEKLGSMNKKFFRKLPNAMAILALHQFNKLDRFNKHRKEVSHLYERELQNYNLPFSNFNNEITPVFMRYPVLVDFNTDKFLSTARTEKIFLNDGWRKSAVVPIDVDINKTGYTIGSCSCAESVSQNIINLPTHINISVQKAHKIINLLKTYEHRN